MSWHVSITVTIPVGPKKHHQAYLDECLESVAMQTIKPNEVLLIDDMADLNYDHVKSKIYPHSNIHIYRSPWRLGVAHAFNFGVALAKNPLVIMLGADDTLEPTCVAECLDYYNKTDERIQAKTYYFLGVRYMDTGEEQYVPCNAAMVSKALWQHTGGFPPESAVGACDAVLGSIMIAHGAEAGYQRCVNEQKPLYNYRRHEQTDTYEKRAWYDVIIQSRHLATLEWKPTQWERYT